MLLPLPRPAPQTERSIPCIPDVYVFLEYFIASSAVIWETYQTQILYFYLVSLYYKQAKAKAMPMPLMFQYVNWPSSWSCRCRVLWGAQNLLNIWKALRGLKLCLAECIHCKQSGPTRDPVQQWKKQSSELNFGKWSICIGWECCKDTMLCSFIGSKHTFGQVFR